MELKEYVSKYKNGEVLFLTEIEEAFPNKPNIRQEIKKMVDKKELNRYAKGIYYIPYISIFGTEGSININSILKKKYIENNDIVMGYTCGYSLCNEWGLTTQLPMVYEIASNVATTKCRSIAINNYRIRLYKPIIPITKENVDTLQFMDMIYNYDKYAELEGAELQRKIRRIMNSKNINIELIKRILPKYPEKIYKNLYYGGIINELV